MTNKLEQLNDSNSGKIELPLKGGIGDMASFPWEELKVLVKNETVKYLIEPKEIHFANGLTAASDYQEFIFPIQLQDMAVHLAAAIWDEGVSMATPARSTKVIKDEKEGTVSVQRFSAWTGPIPFELDA